jgi:hypothetical protein
MSLIDISLQVSVVPSVGGEDVLGDKIMKPSETSISSTNVVQKTH